jgi:hypothetical protein
MYFMTSNDKLLALISSLIIIPGARGKLSPNLKAFSRKGINSNEGTIMPAVSPADSKLI